MENKIKIVNGKEYEINPKKYYQTFKEKHNEKIQCEICDGCYNYFSKYMHFKSKKHLKCQEIIDKNKNI
jgi:hypothetical protein